MVIIVSGMAVDLSMDALTDMVVSGVLTNIGVEVMAGVNVNVCAGVMTAFDFVMTCPFEEFRCS